jgi:hypothetical protein
MVNLASFVIGLHWGITGVAACFAIATTIVQPFYTRAAARAVDSGLVEFLRNLAGVTTAAGIMGVAVLATYIALLHAGVGSVGRLVAAVVVGLATYARLLVEGTRGRRGAAQPAKPGGGVGPEYAD